LHEVYSNIVQILKYYNLVLCNIYIFVKTQRTLPLCFQETATKNTDLTGSSEIKFGFKKIRK